MARIKSGSKTKARGQRHATSTLAAASTAVSTATQSSSPQNIPDLGQLSAICVPPEINIIIFELVLLSTKPIHIRSKARHHKDPWTEPAILRVSKSIRYVAAQVYYGKNIFIVRVNLNNNAMSPVVDWIRSALHATDGSGFGSLQLDVLGRYWSGLPQLLCLLDLIRDNTISFELATSHDLHTNILHAYSIAEIRKPNIHPTAVVFAKNGHAFLRVVREALALGRIAKQDGWSEEELDEDFHAFVKRALASDGGRGRKTLQAQEREEMRLRAYFSEIEAERREKVAGRLEGVVARAFLLRSRLQPLFEQFQRELAEHPELVLPTLFPQSGANPSANATSTPPSPSQPGQSQSPTAKEAFFATAVLPHQIVTLQGAGFYIGTLIQAWDLYNNNPEGSAEKDRAQDTIERMSRIITNMAQMARNGPPAAAQQHPLQQQPLHQQPLQQQPLQQQPLQQQPLQQQPLQQQPLQQHPQQVPHQHATYPPAPLPSPPSAPAAPSALNPASMLRPHEIDNLQLCKAHKFLYKEDLTRLWHRHNTSPTASYAQHLATMSLAAATKQIFLQASRNFPLGSAQQPEDLVAPLPPADITIPSTTLSDHARTSNWLHTNFIASRFSVLSSASLCTAYYDAFLKSSHGCAAHGGLLTPPELVQKSCMVFEGATMGIKEGVEGKKRWVVYGIAVREEGDEDVVLERVQVINQEVEAAVEDE